MVDEIPKAGFIGPESERKPIQLDRLFVAPKTEEVEPPFVGPEQERKAVAKPAETPFASPNPFYVGNPNLNLEIPKAAVEYVNTAPKFVRDLSQKAQEEYNRQVIASAERARTGAVEEDIPILTDPMMGVSFPMPRENIAGLGAVGGSMAEQMLTPLNVAATVASGSLGTVARVAPKVLTEAKLLAGGLNVAATAPAIVGAVEAAEASFENPTPQNIGAFFGNTLIAALGGLGIAYDLTFKAPAKFNPAASAAANKAAQTAEQATARQALEAERIAQEQNNIRAADFFKAKAELHQQAAADLEAALKGGQLAGEETVTLAGTPDQVRLLEIETGKTPGESAREKARILARQPEPLVVDEGLIPPQIELSPQAAALAALEEGKPTPAKSKLLAKPSQPPEGAPSTAGMLLEEPVAAPAAENPRLLENPDAWADKVLADRKGQVSSNLDPELATAYVIKGSMILSRGVKDFATWSTEMVKEFGESIKAQLDVLWAETNKAHGGLTMTRRASGVAASPSIEDINFDRARRNLTSADQASFKLKMQELAPDATVSNAIGDWVDGAENSVAAVFDYNKPVEELRRLAASAGLSRDQKAALWWTTASDGKDAAHFIAWPKDVSIVDARQAMIDAGLENRTLVQTPDGVQGFVFDGGQQALNKIEQLHEHSTNPSIESSRATGEFIGDYSSVKRPDGGREGGRAGARQAYRDVLGTPLKTKARENLLQSTEVGGGGKPTELGGGGVLSTPSRVDPRTGSKTGSPQPNPVVRGLADNYNTQRNLAPITHGHYVPVDESLAQKIAGAYDELPEIDRSPETLNAYQALAKEVSDQWDFAVKNLGIKFEPWVGEGQPYANSMEMMKDVRDNNHMYFFQGGDPHPFLNELDPKTGFTANDKFRAVHDLFGHASEGYQFGPRGEENAWIKHSQMFSPEARRALSTETRGQNSWVNFGTQNYEGGVNKNIPAKDRPYAVQKAALLPEELTDWNSAIVRSEQPTPANQPTLTPEVNPARPSLAENPEGWADSVINEKRGQVNAGLDPELFAAYTVKGSAIFARGVRDFSTWGAQMVKEFGEAIRPQLENLWTSVSRLGDETVDLTKRIGTRNPTAVSSTETGYGNDTVIGLPALKADPVMLDKTNALIKAEYPQIRIKPGQSPVDAMVEFVKGNLVWLHDSIAPEMAKKGIAEDVTARMREWYNGGRKIASNWSKGYDTPIEGIAGSIAALSPQRDWFQNLSLAERVLTVVKRTPYGGRLTPEMDATMSSWIMKTKEDYGDLALSDKTRAYLDAELLDLRSKPFNELDNWQKAVWTRLYSEAHLSKDYNIFTPEGDRLGFATNMDGSRREVTWGSFDQIGNAISIIENPIKENISNRLGSKHKVRNFYNNILLPNDPRFGDVTIDTHAVAAGLLKPLSGTSTEVMHNFGSEGAPGSSISGINGTYAVYAEAYRQAAKERGLLPREMQSITWEAVRGLFEATQKTSKAEGALTDLTQKIWKNYANGKISLDQARTAILKTAGGIESPNWLQSDVGPLADAGITSKRAELPSVQPAGLEPGGPIGGPAGFWGRAGIEEPAGALSPQATRRSDSLFERAREQGSVDPQLLFSTPVQSSLGAVAGGIYGSTEGDTPEERASNMLKYAGLGAAGGILTSKLGRTAMSRKALTSGPTTEMAKHLTPVEGKPLSQVIKEIPGKLKRDWATIYAPLDKLEKDVAEANAGVVSLVPRAIPLSREFEQVAGAAGKAGQEVRDYATNVIDQVGPKDRRAFDEIVALKRIEQRLAWNDRNQSDRKAVGDWTHQKVQADIDKWQQHLGPQRFTELEDIAINQFQKAADDALKLQVASGRMSTEQYKAVKKENDFYAPFEVLDWIDSEANVASRPKVGTGVDTMEPLSKKITGIRNELFHLENPTVSLGKQIWKSRILAEKNLKMRELANLADADVSGKYVRKLESWEEPRRGYETVNYFDNGKKMKLEVGPDVAEAVKGMSVGQTGLLSQFAKRFASTFRFGATSASIPFQPVNFAFADQPMLWLVSKYGLKANPKEFIQAPADFASGMYASMFSNLLGGETGAFAKATENVPIVGEANRRAAELARKFNESGASGAVWQDMLDSMGGAVDEKQLMKSLKIGENSILDGVGAMNKFIEESTKLMGFKRGLRIEGIENMTPKQAEEAIKKVVTEVRNYVGSPDFQRAGREARTLNNVVQMFLNARLQGTTNLGARLAGADGAKAASEAWLRTAGTVGTGAAYLWSLNQEPENKPDYEALSAVEKANYFHVPRYDAKDKPIYSTNDRGERSREYFRIPKREILGYFGNTVDAALNFAQDQDPEAAGKFAVQMMESLSPVNVSGKNLTERIESVVGGANPLIKVPYETISGRETFRHRPIVPAGDLQKASAEQQYLPSTPKLFVSAAQAMPEGAPDVLRSPLRLQQLVGGLVGPLVSQFVAKPQSADRDPLAAGLASNPLTARLVSTGYTERADEKAAVERAETEAADVRVERRREAQNEIDRIRKLPESQRGKAILDLGTEKPEVFKALEKELRYQSEDPITRRIRGLGERDGTRARFIVNRIRELKDPQKVTDFLTRLSEGPEPALTEEVMAQVEAIAGAGSSPANTSPRR